MKTILIMTMAAFAATHAQERQFTRLALGFAPGFLTAQSAIAYAVAAEAEWYRDGRVSWRGDLYALAGKSKPGTLQQNYQALFGLVYTFDRTGSFAPFAGFQPGVGFAGVNNGVADGLYVYPVLSPVAGVHIFSGARWHATVSLRYVFGELSYTDTGSVYLSELRAGVGLGYSY